MEERVAQRGIQVLLAIIPPDSPGASIRVVYDPDLTPGLLAYEVGNQVKKLAKRITPKKPKEEAPPAG